MQRKQTTKELAARIDPGYVRGAFGLQRLRPLLVIICIAVAVAWWAVGKASRRRAMLSPGHVSAAHAMWENDCAVCHDLDGKGGFRQAVKDQACIQCHSAPAHHPAQLLRTGEISTNPLALAVVDSQGRLRSAECVACHLEHRGSKSLASVANGTCVKCHGNIVPAIQPGASRTTADATAFNEIGGHPYFGRTLLAPGKEFPQPAGSRLSPPDVNALQDPIRLRFNHGKKEHADLIRNCASCHSNRDGRYMQPVYTFANNCMSGCHEMKLPGGTVLPHGRLELALGRLAQIDDAQFRQSLSEWAGGLKEGSLPGAPALENELVKLPDEAKIDPDAAAKNVHLVTAYLAYGINQSCAKCHDVRQATAPTSVPTTMPAETKTLNSVPMIPAVSTVLTGVAEGGRLWYIHGGFDHRAHQFMKCESCHVQPNGGDIPVPNLVWQSAAGTIVSCAVCHHPNRGDERGAGSDCIECHKFHDPSIPTTPPAAKCWTGGG